MSATRDFLFVLGSYRTGYRFKRARMREVARELAMANPSLRRTYTDATIRVAISRFKRKGLITREGRMWNITQKRKEYLEKKIFPRHSEQIPKKKEKQIIIAFDIPEKEKQKRNWLRTELRNLGFQMLQQSVWFGPAPMPKSFVESLKTLELLHFLKFFEAKETDII